MDVDGASRCVENGFVGYRVDGGSSRLNRLRSTYMQHEVNVHVGMAKQAQLPGRIGIGRGYVSSVSSPLCGALIERQGRIWNIDT